MEENWCALLIATQFEITPEEAFEFYWNDKKYQVLNMIKQKEEGLTYKRIGKIYGISADAVHSRIQYYMQKQKLKC